MAVNAQASLKNGQGVPFIVRASGPDAATAEAHLKAKLLLIKGTIVKVTESAAQLNADYPPGAAGDGTSFELTLQIGTDTATARTETIVNGLGGLGLAADPATIDVSKAAIAAYAAAYRDSDGVGGYSAVRGHYLKS
jgi:hypothetical protein